LYDCTKAIEYKKEKTIKQN